MMEYNTKQKRLPLPEYGRSVQKMVDHAMTIEDRSERQRCAETIVQIMSSMFPNLRNELPNYKQKLWDHLAIMSGFALDIDYPFEIIKEETFTQPPAQIPYQKGEITNKHYGRIVEDMIAHACTLDEGEERDRLIELILIQMKKNYITWNKDTVEDKRIFDDLRICSQGRINISEGEIKLGGTKSDNQNRNFAKRKKVFKKKF